VIFLDSNLFVIDLRYPGDVHHSENRRALARLAREGIGTTSLLNVLEVCGILSFNLAPRNLLELYAHFSRRYRVTVLPGGEWESRLPAPTAREVLARMEKHMALKDAEIALVVEQHRSSVDAFLSWNARHFVGKLPVPALTPGQWLRRRMAGRS